MGTITLDPPTTDGRTLRTTAKPSGELARFFGENTLEVTYDTPIDDVSDSILVIPALAQVCPVAWAAGADVCVDTVDDTFAAALESIEASMLEMYDFFDGGTLYVRARPEATEWDEGESATVDSDGAESTGSGNDSGILFTGGVDSTCSYVRHREESPTLISIRGWTIRLDATDDEQWRHQVERTRRFAEKRDLASAFVEANMLSFLDHGMLLAHYKRFVDGAWYSSVGHGLGLLGLCAPLAAARGLEDLYIAATHWEGIDLEWGSRPDIDDHVRWQGTCCHHDGYDLTRQERLDLIAEYVRTEDGDLTFQTCNDRMDRNCSACEKCYRTAVGLRLSGLDPREHGYDFGDEDYAKIRDAFEEGRWVLGDDERHMWANIRERTRDVDPRSADERAFFTWLQRVDLSSLVADSDPPLSQRLVRAAARHTPTGVYRTLAPVWTQAKTR